MFPVYGFMPFGEHLSLPVGLYMNGELAQVQSEGLALKSSILRSRNTCL